MIRRPDRISEEAEWFAAILDKKRRNVRYPNKTNSHHHHPDPVNVSISRTTSGERFPLHRKTLSIRSPEAVADIHRLPISTRTDGIVFVLFSFIHGLSTEDEFFP